MTPIDREFQCAVCGVVFRTVDPAPALKADEYELRVCYDCYDRIKKEEGEVEIH